MSQELQPLSDLLQFVQVVIQKINTGWQPVHRWLAVNQKKLKKIFWCAILLVGFVAPVGLLVAELQLGYGLMYALGSKLGTLAILVYLLTLVPGITKRLGWTLLPTVSLMLFRRQLGIMMYVLAAVHVWLVQMIPNQLTFNPVILTDLRLLAGLSALLIAGLLFITANDWSIKLLHHRWQQLHRVTYALLFLLFLHVGLRELSLGLMLLAFAGLEIWSWWHFWQHSAKPQVQ